MELVERDAVLQVYVLALKNTDADAASRRAIELLEAPPPDV